MASTSQQAKADGTLEEDYDPAHPTQVSDREQPLVDGFKARGWTVVNVTSNAQSRLTTLKVKRGTHAFTLEAFVFPNLAWSSGGRSEYEKRIQLSRDYAEHKAEFDLPKSGARRCALLGLYRRDGKTIICAWDAAAYKNHSNPSSCYVRVEAIAYAMRTGFGQSVDGKNRLVCCFEPDLLPFYAENMEELHERVLVNQLDIKSSPDGEPADEAGSVKDTDLGAPNPIPADLPRNRIIYGAPGTGKSHKLQGDISAHFQAAGLSERITFHPDYTYSQFVGSYRPTPLYRDGASELLAADKVTQVGTKEPLIDYQFVPGPFLRMLVRALKHPEHSFVLVIEELNRANAPAVFGEVFQLLDRGADGEGKFEVRLPSEALEYLRAQGITQDIRLPKNLYLWATMNSADQGVLPLDAAFKRRWSFEYQALNAEEAVTAAWTISLKFLTQPVGWNAFRKAINDHLLGRDVPEDRLLGPFFMRQEELADESAFKNKLLLYLRDDVVRHNPDALFAGASLTYGALAEAYASGQNIFADEILFGSASA